LSTVWGKYQPTSFGGERKRKRKNGKEKGKRRKENGKLKFKRLNNSKRWQKGTH
jgi:hypothetical protein